MSDPGIGDSEGKKAPEETGDKSTEGKKHKPARFPRRGSLSRAGDLWFRFVTRLRAVAYWLREKAQALWRWIKRAAGALAHWWSKRSRGTRIRILAVAGVVVLYLIIKFLPVPGVPCEISAAKECAPSNDTIAYVPRDALLYAHLTVNSSSHQWELAENLHDQLPNFVALLQSDTSSLATPGGRPVDLGQEVLPWAKDDLALIGVPGPKKTTSEAYVVGVGDNAQANSFLNSLSPGGTDTPSSVGDASAQRLPERLRHGPLGRPAPVRQRRGGAGRPDVTGRAGARDWRDPSRTRPGPSSRTSALPSSISLRAGIGRMLAGRAGTASQLGTFVDYGATTGMAASLRARDDGVEVNLVSDLDPKLEQRSPTVFASLPQFEPSLAGEAGSSALGYVGIGDLGPAVAKALETAGSGAQGVAGSLRTLGQTLRQQAGVDPFKDLLPALGGQAALIAEPTDSVPYASLIVDGVDEQKTGDALASLQQPILKAAAAGGRQQVPSFQSKEIDGVAVHSVQVSPAVDLCYAIFDRKLVISTQPEGIAQVRSGGDDLSGTSAYQAATDHLPDSVSALVFLNLNEVLGLAQRAGLAEDPLYASLSEDISHVESLGLAVRGSDEQIRSELFLAIHH